MFNAELGDAGLFGAIARHGDLCIHAVLDLRRSFSRAELERALAATIADFPVLGRRYEPRFWRDRWVPVEGPLSDAVHCIDEPADLEAETERWARRSIEPLRERQLRLVSLRRGAGSRLIVSIMHLAVDGGGAGAVGHVLGSHLYGVAPSVPVDARRGLAHALAGLRWFHWPVVARDIVATLLQPMRTRGAAPRVRAFPMDPSGGASWRHLVISSAELEQLKLRGRAHGASVNDVLLAALARVSAARSAGGSVAVTYTMDLRRYGAEPRLTAANTSSILTAIVPRHALGDLAAAAREVAEITARHRGSLVGPAFVLTPYVLALGAPHAFVRRFVRLMLPTAVDLPLSRGLMVTNVGRIDEGLRAFGDDIEDLRIIGPNLEGLSVPAVVAFGFRGQLHLQLFAAPGLSSGALLDLERELRAALEIGPATP